MSDDGDMLFKFVIVIFILVVAGVGVKYAFSFTDKNMESVWSAISMLNVKVDRISMQSMNVNMSSLSGYMKGVGSPTLEFLSSTEYNYGDGNGSTIIKLADWKGDKISTTCYEKILYPDKSVYIDWSNMTYQVEYGNYYMEFAVPAVLGNYDQEIRCLVSGKNVSLGKAFHVANVTSMIAAKIDSKIDELHQDVMVVLD